MTDSKGQAGVEASQNEKLAAEVARMIAEWEASSEQATQFYR